jgi:hypothetical protein
MFYVYQEGDKVLLDLKQPVRDILLTCGQAEVLENELRQKADLAELATPEIIKGETWDLKVESYDGLVAIRIIPPFGVRTDRVPLPSAAARKLADMVQFKCQQAAYKMRFVIDGQYSLHQRPGRTNGQRV